MQKYNPATIDTATFMDLSQRYGGKLVEGRAEEILRGYQLFMSRGEDPTMLDEWAPSGLKSPEEIAEIFTKRLYFGCEGDDPLNALAFDTKGSPFNAKLYALYGSDVGHWDIPDMKDAAHEAYELVEDGLISEADFRDMVFTNAAKFWTSTNPNFFQGTVVEDAVRQTSA